MRVLITAPSLDEKRNVSGISTVVRQIIEHGENEYVHFQAGREDREAAGVRWMLKHITLPLSLFWTILRNRIELVHINTALTELSIFRDAALALAAKLSRRPLVLSIHGGKYLMNSIESRWLAMLTEGMLRRARTVVVLSELEKEQLERRWSGINIHVLPNAVELRRDEVPPRDNAVPVIVYFGRMHESKGLNELIEAARELSAREVEFRVRAFGEGPMREFFVEEMETVLGDRFKYGGVATKAEKRHVLEGSDIFVLPSRYGEGLPMALLEAMAAGCVVVAADVASVATVIRNGENGYLVAPGDAEQLASTLTKLLRHPTGWQPVRENAVMTIREDFNIERHMIELQKIYREALA